MTERGRVLSYGTGLKPAMEAPRLLPQAVVQTPALGPETYHRYANSEARYLHLKIVAIAGDDEDIALCQAVMSYPEHWDGHIKFVDWYFATPHLSVARYLDKRIRLGMIRGISRDAASIMMRCAQCDEMFANTPHGQEQYMKHLVEEHPANVLSYTAPPAPAAVAGVPQVGGPDRYATEEEQHPPVALDAPQELAFGEDFSLTGEQAIMESADESGTEDTERVLPRNNRGRGK